MHHEDDEALLRTYITSWSKFLDQSIYLPMPFFVMEQSGSSNKNNTSSQNNRNASENYVRKLMLDTWSRSIFSEIKYRLQNSAMKIIFSERIGEAFDSLLVVGVRESYGNFTKNNLTTELNFLNICLII